MLHFVLGRNGSGKTEYLRGLLSKKLATQSGACILLVPEQFSFESERAMLDLVGAKKLLRADILSFTRLAHSVGEYAGKQHKLSVDDGARVLIMSLVLEALQDKLQYFSKFTARSALIKQLLTFVTELKQCDVAPQSLHSAAVQTENTLLKTKLNELNLIAELYNAMLSQHYYDDLDLLTETAQLIPQTDYFKGKTVCIDAFAGFTKQERNVLEQIMRQADDVWISLCTDSKSKNGGFSVFDNVTQEYMHLKTCAQRQGVRIAEPVMLSAVPEGKDPALCFLEQKLYAPKKERYAQAADSICICAAGNRADECDFVARSIKHLLLDEKLRCREIAVVERTQDTYDKELTESFKKYGIPYFEDKRQPIENQPLITLIHCLLKAASVSLTTETLMRYLKSGLTGLADEDIAELENYAVMWKIDGTKWRDDFTANPDGLGLEMTETREKRLEALNAIRKKAVGPILSFRKSFAEKTGREKSELLYRYLVREKIRDALVGFAAALNQNGKAALAEEQNDVWEALMQMLDKLAAVVGDRVISAKRYAELFEILLSTIDLGRIPQGLDDVLIGAADRMRIPSCRAVFVIGANSGVFPLDPPTDGILNDRERKWLESAGIILADTAEYKVVDERFAVYRALTGATEKLYVSYSLADFKGKTLFPSEIITELHAMFPAVKTVDTALLSAAERIESTASAFEALAEHIRENSVLTQTLRLYFDKQPDYAARVAALHQLVQHGEMKFREPAVAKALFGENMQISASRSELYYKCPFEYFCKYGIEAKPRKTAELDPAQSGTVIHFVLEKVLKTYPRAALTAMSRPALNEAVRAALHEYIEIAMGGTADKPKRFLYLYNRLCDTLTEVLERIAEEMRVSSFVPTDFELKIDHDAQVKPYTVSLPGGGVLQIRGSVDRVDVMEKDGKSYIRVVDYKSGGKKFALSDIFSGLNMQMMLYLFAIYENGAQRYGEIMPAGVLYMPAKEGSESLHRGASAEEVKLEKLKSARLNGLITYDEAVIGGMDCTVSGYYVNVLKDSKNGGYKGDLITLEQLGKLKNKLDQVLRDMAVSLQNGKIPVLPASGTNYKNTCAFCDYKAVCGFENGAPVREIPAFSLKQAQAILEQEETRGGNEEMDAGTGRRD